MVGILAAFDFIPTEDGPPDAIFVGIGVVRRSMTRMIADGQSIAGSM